MAKVKWIKLATGVFDNRKIRQIECLPDGDSIIVIWMKLLCLAGDINDCGMVYFTKEIPYTDQMLAQQFNRPLITIQMALNTFQQFGMIELVDDILYISNWEKYQNVDGMEKIKEQNRLRQKRWYDKQKALAEPNVIPNVSITQPNDTDIDIDKEIDKDKELYITIVDYLNKKADTSYKHTTKKTKEAINARVAEGFTVDDFKTVIDKKCAEWMGTEFEQYLRPATLFGTKLESYLNAKVITKRQNVPNIDVNKTDLDEFF